MKKAKMYIPIVGPQRSVSLVCANKIPELEHFIPCEEALRVHIEMEKIKAQKDIKYGPQPLAIKVERGIFMKIILKIRAKNKYALLESIPLVLQYPAIPICMIEPYDE